MEYDTIIVPGCETLRTSTLERLETFRKAGGRLIFLGEAPKLCDAVESEKGKALYDISENCDFTRSAIITALESDKVVNLRKGNGVLSDNLIYQLRQDEDCKWLFVAHSKEPHNSHIDTGEDIRITVKGEYGVLLYDTQNGNIYPADYSHRNGNTIIAQHIYGYDSFLYKLVDKNSVAPQKKEVSFNCDAATITGLVDYELSEENVLLLDMAEHKIEGEAEFSPKEEILRLDNICRNKLGIEERGGAKVTGFRITDYIPTGDVITEEQLWENYAYFLKAVIPAAEKYNINLALHPDDPPLAKLGDVSRIMISAKNIRRAIYEIYPSPNLGLTFCQANFHTMGEDVYSLIPQMADKIMFIHFRNVTGSKEDFRETFHDNGELNMARLIHLYKECGIHVPIRVDHVPTMLGEDMVNMGYDALGRHFAIGYLKGLLEAAGA